MISTQKGHVSKSHGGNPTCIESAYEQWTPRSSCSAESLASAHPWTSPHLVSSAGARGISTSSDGQLWRKMDLLMK